MCEYALVKFAADRLRPRAVWGDSREKNMGSALRKNCWIGAGRSRCADRLWCGRRPRPRRAEGNAIRTDAIGIDAEAESFQRDTYGLSYRTTGSSHCPGAYQDRCHPPHRADASGRAAHHPTADTAPDTKARSAPDAEPDSGGDDGQQL